MEGYWDERRDERDRLWARRDMVYDALKGRSLAAFTVEQFADLQLVCDRKAVSERTGDLQQALTRFEAFIAGPVTVKLPKRSPRKKKR